MMQPENIVLDKSHIVFGEPCFSCPEIKVERQNQI